MERNTYHVGLWNYARQYFRAADKLRGQEERLSDAPTYYLYAHAIELTLKSLLVFRGYSEKDIRKIGHNIIDAWEKSLEEGLGRDFDTLAEVKQTIDLINPYYEEKELEYIVTGGKQYPLISNMHSAAQSLIFAVGKHIDIPKPQLNR